MTTETASRQRTASTTEQQPTIYRFPEDLIVRETVPGQDASRELDEIMHSGDIIEVNYLNEYGHTVLGTSAFLGSLKCCQILVHLGADVSKKDADGWTALHYALAKGFLDVARYLILNGGSLYTENNDDDAALDFIEDREIQESLVTHTVETLTTDNPFTVEVLTTSNPLIVETLTSGNPLTVETLTTTGNPLIAETLSTGNPLTVETLTTDFQVIYPCGITYQIPNEQCLPITPNGNPIPSVSCSPKENVQVNREEHKEGPDIRKRGRWCKTISAHETSRTSAVYEGTTSWEDYEAQFEMVADLNDWNSEEKAAYLAVSLVGQARTVLGDLSGEERRNFKSLTAALATRFGTENKTEMFRVNVKNRQREKDESLPELAQAIRRLTRQAYPSAAVDLRDILARDYFLDAITETDMRWKIRQARPKSLNEALGVAVELEAFMSAEKQRQRSARAAQVTTNSAENDKTKKTNDGLREEIEELKRLVQGLCSVQQNHQRFRGDGCWACGDKNHLRRDCPKRAQTTKQQVNSPLSGNDSLPSSRA
ncbi:hypothetical protein QZH41_002118 [Actinostola sp. cb2023]|nr:hypothetical protein QZH41_002118 [Actinostola sp. cb2023]